MKSIRSKGPFQNGDGDALHEDLRTPSVPTTSQATGAKISILYNLRLTIFKNTIPLEYSKRTKDSVNKGDPIVFLYDWSRHLSVLLLYRASDLPSFHLLCFHR